MSVLSFTERCATVAQSRAKEREKRKNAPLGRLPHPIRVKLGVVVGRRRQGLTHIHPVQGTDYPSQSGSFSTISFRMDSERLEMKVRRGTNRVFRGRRAGCPASCPSASGERTPAEAEVDRKPSAEGAGRTEVDRVEGEVGRSRCWLGRSASEEEEECLLRLRRRADGQEGELRRAAVAGGAGRRRAVAGAGRRAETGMGRVSDEREDGKGE